MSLYFVTYELRKDKNYKEIIDELERFGAIRILNSHWCLKKLDTSTEELRSHFKNL